MSTGKNLAITGVIVAVTMIVSRFVSPPDSHAAAAGAAVAAAAVPIPAKPEAKADPAFEQQRAAVLGILALQNAMRNPDSFQLVDILAMPNGALCYSYRAQNGFGGMDLDHAAVFNGTLSTKSWDAKCAGRTGKDITGKVREMLHFVQTHHMND